MLEHLGIARENVLAVKRAEENTVEDDGIGMPEETLTEMRRRLNENIPSDSRKHSGRSNGIAMQNVNQRIKVYFGDQYGIDISSTEGVGTSVFITLPLAV